MKSIQSLAQIANRWGESQSSPCQVWFWKSSYVWIKTTGIICMCPRWTEEYMYLTFLRRPSLINSRPGSMILSFSSVRRFCISTIRCVLSYAAMWLFIYSIIYTTVLYQCFPGERLEWYYITVQKIVNDFIIVPQLFHDKPAMAVICWTHRVSRSYSASASSVCLTSSCNNSLYLKESTVTWTEGNIGASLIETFPTLP